MQHICRCASALTIAVTVAATVVPNTLRSHKFNYLYLKIRIFHGFMFSVFAIANVMPFELVQICMLNDGQLCTLSLHLCVVLTAPAERSVVEDQ